MKMRERVLLIVGLVLIFGTAVALRSVKSRQRLGKPGVKATTIPGSILMNIELATNVLGYVFEELPVAKFVTEALPKDTSIRQGGYLEREGAIQTVVVMMGTDRTSIHRPQFCLTGAGWSIDESRSKLTKVRLTRPKPVDLPVMKLIVERENEIEGRKIKLSGVYVYWFVAEDMVTADHEARSWLLAKHMLRTGELQRWSYITYFAVCAPGHEERAFSRIERLMNATVPEFQLAWPK